MYQAIPNLPEALPPPLYGEVQGLCHGQRQDLLTAHYLGAVWEQPYLIYQFQNTRPPNSTPKALLSHTSTSEFS